MHWLQKHGFIDIKPGAAGDMSYAIILNPYHVIRRHHLADHPGVTEARFIALMARAHEISVPRTLDEELPSDRPRSRQLEGRSGRRDSILET